MKYSAACPHAGHNQYTSAYGNLLWSLTSHHKKKYGPLLKFRPISYEYKHRYLFPSLPAITEGPCQVILIPKLPVEIPKEELSSHELTCSGVPSEYTRSWWFLPQHRSGYVIENRFSQRSTYFLIWRLSWWMVLYLSEGSTGKTDQILYMSWKSRHTS